MEPKEANRRRIIARELLKWFDRHRRAFPWRETFDKPDPYVILFTEIMLQRTRAEQVVPVYLEFVKKYPTFRQLARAPDGQVLALFSKLGLNWRAQNVVRLIRTLEGRYGGEVPHDIVELKNLPAVGDYAAKAVLCYAFGDVLAPIDTNVVRIISRLFGLSMKSDTARRSKRISELTESLMPRGRSRDLNLSLLDFAAEVCRPRPLCQVCPLREQCEYYKTSLGERA